MITLGQDSNTKTRLIYVFDPLCGWCYGFTPVIERFAEQHPELREEVISGGMITGDRIGPIGEVAPYIKTAYKDVENTTGIKFGEPFLKDILDEGSAIFTSIPPSVALAIVKDINPEKAFPFSKLLQKSIYYYGNAPEKLEQYQNLAEELGIDTNGFLEKMEDEEYLKLAERDFQMSNSLGVNGFPTVFIVSGGSIIPIARGYVDNQTLESNYQRALEMVKNK
ncbi:MAG: DsbA family protein [Candidatus Kapaibacteriales bacterium]